MKNWLAIGVSHELSIHHHEFYEISGEFSAIVNHGKFPGIENSLAYELVRVNGFVLFGDPLAESTSVRPVNDASHV